jgi:hypothetical protein
MQTNSGKFFGMLILCLSIASPSRAQQSVESANSKPPSAVAKAEDEDEVELRRADIADAASKIAKTDANKVARTVRTFAVRSDTWLVPRDLVLEAIQNHKDFPGLDLVLVNDWQLAQVRVEVGYVDWTFDYTYKAIDQKRDVLIASGKVTQFNGYLAAPAVADAVIEKLKKDRENATSATGSQNERGTPSSK